MFTRYVNFHILHNVPFSNPNRDDVGAPKRTVYGGETRGRLSSQSDKRASRVDFEALSGADRTTRSKHITKYLLGRTEQVLHDAGVDVNDQVGTKVREAVHKEVRNLTNSENKASSDDDKSDELKGDTLVWVAERELDSLVEEVVEAVQKSKDDGLDALKSIDIKKVMAGDGGSMTTESLTIAAFGRMFASAPDLNMEAAAQVGHAITTHRSHSEPDFFSAVDEMPAADEGAGAGHIGIAQYHSGVFYRYFSINRDDLVSNWGPLARSNDEGLDDEEVERLYQFIESMVVKLPTGKESTAAHQTMPSAVLVTFSTRGMTYAPAFEQPVQPASHGGLIVPSVDRLETYADKVATNLGDDNRLSWRDDVDGTPLSVNMRTVAQFLADGTVSGDAA